MATSKLRLRPTVCLACATALIAGCGSKSIEEKIGEKAHMKVRNCERSGTTDDGSQDWLCDRVGSRDAVGGYIQDGKVIGLYYGG